MQSTPLYKAQYTVTHTSLLITVLKPVIALNLRTYMKLLPQKAQIYLTISVNDDLNSEK